MSARRILSRFVNGTVLMVLLFGSLPAATASAARPAAPPAAQPQPPSSGASAYRLTPAEAPVESAPAAMVEAPPAEQAADAQGSAVPQSPETCSAPAKVPFGQDLELLMGLQWSHTTNRIEQPPAWGASSAVSKLGSTTVATTGCTTSGPLGEEVYFYENADYGGSCYILAPGSYADGTAMGVHNDHLSSVKVGANARVVIYEDKEFGGGSASFESNIPKMSDTSIHNDHASSAKVWFEPEAYGNVAAASWGTDRNLILMKTDSASGELAHIGWDAASGWGLATRRGLSTASNPIALSRGLDMAYFARSGVNIKYAMSNQGVWSAWANVPGIADAASDPVIIEPDIYHFKLFYRTSAGVVKFTEWESGIGWRSTPLSLGTPSGTTFSSDLAAVARDETHAAVFGVGANNKLYVKAWSDSNNKSDWSDTTWVELASSIKVATPAVTSRSVDHIGVAAVNTSNLIVYREWTYQAGWKTLATIGGYVEPVGLAATAGDEMYLYGLSSNNLYTNRWTSAGGWAGWTLQEGGWAASQAPAAVVGRPHDLMLVGRNTSNRLISKRLTNQGQPLTATATNNPNYGVPRGQAVATVNGRTAWVSAWRGSEGYWIIAARDTATWSGTYIFLDNPVPSVDTDRVSLTTADLDYDGNDEIILGTLNEAGTAMRLSVYRLTHSGTAVTAITRASYADIGTGSSWRDVQVAVGDLDGDGLRKEVVIGALWQGYNQVYVRAYAYTTGLSYRTQQNIWFGGSAAEDLEMAIGQVDSQAGEQLVLTAGGYGSFILGDIDIASYKYDPNTATFAQAYTFHWFMPTYTTGPYATALAVGDPNSDGIDEVIYTNGNHIVFVKMGVPSTFVGIVPVGPNDANRSLAAGDVDGDGRAEVVYTNSYPWMGVLKWVSPGSFIWTGQASVLGVPLLADLDGDSAIATFKRCDEVTDVKVLGVVNSQPVWYQGSASVQNSGGGMANSSSASTGEADGWKTSFGGSIKVGFEHEFEVPLLAIKVGEVRASVTQEFMGGIGGSTEKETSTTETEGVSFGSQAFGMGAVCYTQTAYKCYKYELSKPGSAITSTAQSCVPVPNTGMAPQLCSALEDWHTTAFKQAAGNSWAPVGHRPPNTTTASVNLGWANNYPVLAAPPVDPYRVWWVKKTPMSVQSSVNPASVTQDWSVETTVATKTISSSSFEANTEVSAGFTAGDVTFDASLKVGAGGEWSSSVGWETGLEFNGHVYNYPSTCASPCQPYSIVPYVYKAQAKTLSGATYNYLEQDYYVTRIGLMELDADAADSGSDRDRAEPQAIAGVAPQAPVVTSTTQPDPATWYPTSTASLEWGQPAGDPAVVTGYKWNLTRTPVFTPTSIAQAAAGHTYADLADGVYYLHLQAVGDGGDLSPVTHRAVRVDTAAPQVALVADPAAPTGFTGWHKTPVTVSVTATDTVGSGVAAVETSADGSTWLPYGAPIPITANTPGTAVWARATDGVGHTSEPVSTTLKLDKTAPTTVDSDGYGLSYASILTDEVGNAQLVLGGALNDALSGRLQVEVKAGDTGTWNAVSAVGDMPVPPGNQFSTTMTSLQWIYTPTFELRGVYPLWARGVDAAGNYEPAWVHGAFWWEPDDTPVLSETLVSAAPRQANPGGEVDFTIAARNTGYQEAQMRITNTVPAGLTVVTETIGHGGQYNAGARQIVWTLHALWPGQAQYLHFKATADATAAPVTLTDQVDVMAYWPWEQMPGVPAEPARHYYSTTTTVIVLPAAPGLAAEAVPVAPRILDAAVVEGDIVDIPQVTILVNATPNARQLLVKEWTYDAAIDRWSLKRDSGWVPFEAAAGFEVFEDEAGRYGRYQWTLSAGDGVKYLGVWVADAAGNATNLNESNLIRANLLSAGGQQLAAGQRVQYRVSQRAGSLAVYTLVSLSGDADLHVWKPRAGFMPHYYSNGLPAGGGLSFDTVGFIAPEEGTYVVEVQAATDAYYRLVASGDLSGAGLLAETQADPALARLTESDLAALKAQDESLVDARQALPQGTRLPLADKARPDHPLSLSTPYSLGAADLLPVAPEVPTLHWLHLPLVFR